jgi:hypothetical protein
MLFLKRPPNRSTPQGVSAALADHIRRVAESQHGIKNIESSLAPDQAIEVLFFELRRQHPERLIVLTVDEYDAPVNSFLPHDPASAKKMALTLVPFYTKLKGLTKDLHVMFVTGITKFSMTSMFSGPN